MKKSLLFALYFTIMEFYFLIALYGESVQPPPKPVWHVYLAVGCAILCAYQALVWFNAYLDLKRKARHGHP